MRVERFVRRDEEEWAFQGFEGPDGIVPLGLAAGITLPLCEIYARVALPERPER